MINKIEALQQFLVEHGANIVIDGIWGPKSRAALSSYLAKMLNPRVNLAGWNKVKASSFADPQDIIAFKRCKLKGHSDQACFKVGDNGIGKWGKNTTLPIPYCALPRDDWKHLDNPAGTVVLVRDEKTGKTIETTLEDTMPWKRNIKNGAGIDLNPEACRLLGYHPPISEKVAWKFK